MLAIPKKGASFVRFGCHRRRVASQRINQILELERSYFSLPQRPLLHCCASRSCHHCALCCCFSSRKAVLQLPKAHASFTIYSMAGSKRRVTGGASPDTASPGLKRRKVSVSAFPLFYIYPRASAMPAAVSKRIVFLLVVLESGCCSASD